jgi:hypothetical protein
MLIMNLSWPPLLSRNGVRKYTESRSHSLSKVKAGACPRRERFDQIKHGQQPGAASEWPTSPMVTAHSPLSLSKTMEPS